jgi:WD40 repeat protein
MRDGKSFVTFDLSAGEILVHDARTGTPIRRLTFDYSPSASALSPKGELAIGTFKGGVDVLDVATGEKTATFEAHRGRVAAVAFSPGEDRLATAGADHRVRVWDMRTGTRLASYTVPQEARSLPFDAAGLRIAVTSLNGNVTILHTAAPADPSVLRGHESYVYAVAFDPAGRTFATADYSGLMRLWDARTYAPIGRLRNPYPFISSLRFSDDGSRLVAVAADVQSPGRVRNRVSVWDLASRTCIATRDREARGIHGEAGLPLDPHADRIVLSWGSGDEVTAWDVEEDTVAPARLPDGLLATYDEDRKKLVVHDFDRKQDRDFDVDLKYWTVAFSSSSRGGRMFAAPLPERHPETGEPRVTIGVWETRTGRRIGALSGHTREVLAVAFSPDDSRVATGSRDATIRLWDTATMEEIARLDGHTMYVKDLAFSPDGTQLVSASGDETVRIWDTVAYGERNR